MFPKRGAIALVTTVLALILLLSFKTPEPATPGDAVLGDAGGSLGTSSADIGSSADGSVPSDTAGPAATDVPSAGPSAGPAGTVSPASPAPKRTASPTQKPAAAAAATVTGSTVGTPFGRVAVQITVANGKIKDVRAVTLPSRGRSGEISNYVEPILASEALQAQSAKIDLVSGATYTSEAYVRSLQSALDQAGIASAGVTG